MTVRNLEPSPLNSPPIDWRGPLMVGNGHKLPILCQVSAMRTSRADDTLGVYYPTLRRGRMKRTSRNVCAAVAVVAALVVASTAPAWAVTTSAFISCHKKADSSFMLGPHIHTSTSGIQYPRGIQIDVIQQWFEDGSYFASDSTRIYTSSSGSWSVPSDTRFANWPRHNKFAVKVFVSGPRQSRAS